MNRLISVLCLLLVLLSVGRGNHLFAQVLPIEGRLVQKEVTRADSLKILEKTQSAVDTSGVNEEVAWQYFVEAERMSRAAGSKYLYGNVLLQEAVLYFQKAKYEASIQACKLAASYFAESNATLKEVRCYANLGMLYQYEGNYADALKFLFMGLRLVQGQKGNSDLIGSLYTNISNAYGDLNDLDNALNYALKAEKNNAEDKDTADLGGNYNTIGEIYKNKNEPDKAIHYFKLAITFHQMAGDQKRAAGSTTSLSTAYLSKNDIDSALYYQSQVLDYAIAHKTDHFSDYCYAITTYGYMLAASGKTAAAKKYYEQCQSCKPLLPNLGYAINYYSFLYQYFKNLGRPELALQYMEKLKEVNDSLNVASRKFENQRIAIRYEFDARAKEDSLKYQLNITKQQVATATYKNRMYLLLVVILIICGAAVALIRRIRKSQNEKRKLALETMRNNIASDLHDDIGSTLSSIQIISSLALQQCASNPMLKASVGQISQLSDKVSDGIREIVWSVNPAHDKLKSIIDLMRKLAAEVLGPNDIGFKFQEKIKDQERLLSPQLRKDLLMIFKEAINNARKYSGTRQVDISIHQEGNLLSLQIKDYGAGFDLDKVLKGNGLDNMKKRASDMNAILSIHSRPGNGTFLCLKIPLP